MRKPKDLIFKNGRFEDYFLCVNDGLHKFAELSPMYTAKPKQLRRIAKWCEAAANWMEGD